MSSFKLCKCGSLASWNSYFGGYYCHNCGLILEDGLPDGGREGYMTNADKIRYMSDEELSKWLCQALDCDFCKAYLQNMSINSCCENQEKGIFDWLQRTAEEDT